MTHTFAPGGGRPHSWACGFVASHAYCCTTARFAGIGALGHFFSFNIAFFGPPCLANRRLYISAAEGTKALVFQRFFFLLGFAFALCLDALSSAPYSRISSSLSPPPAKLFPLRVLLFRASTHAGVARSFSSHRRPLGISLFLQNF